MKSKLQKLSFLKNIEGQPFNLISVPIVGFNILFQGNVLASFSTLEFEVHGRVGQSGKNMRKIWENTRKHENWWENMVIYNVLAIFHKHIFPTYWYSASLARAIFANILSTMMIDIRVSENIFTNIERTIHVNISDESFFHICRYFHSYGESHICKPMQTLEALSA